LALARDIGCALGVEPHVCVVSRLLIDTNRGLRSPRLFTDDTISLSSEERAHLIATVHRPHQDAVAASVVSALDAHDRVLYLSVHSFTPVLAGDVRDVDVGILFDPARDPEVAFAAAWMRSLRGAAPSLRFRPNAPYSGLDEGLDRDLRERFRDRPLLALTLEVNQAFPQGPPEPWEALRAALTTSLVSVLAQE
jgi:predicted N-formylglutamate amidohydrolase